MDYMLENLSPKEQEAVLPILHELDAKEYDFPWLRFRSGNVIQIDGDVRLDQLRILVRMMEAIQALK